MNLHARNHTRKMGVAALAAALTLACTLTQAQQNRGPGNGPPANAGPALPARVAALEEAVATLQRELEAERGSRAAADRALQEALAAETAARVAAEARLQALIEAETVARDAAVGEVRAALAAEARLREAGDSRLQSLLDC